MTDKQRDFSLKFTRGVYMLTQSRISTLTVMVGRWWRFGKASGKTSFEER
jgi:hypothetical protein